MVGGKEQVGDENEGTVRKDGGTVENVAAEREMDRRSVEQKQQMDWGAAERGAGTQPLLWLLSLCRQFCCLSHMFCLSAGPFGRRFGSRRHAVVFLSPNFALSFSEALPSDPHPVFPLLCLIFTSTVSSAFLPIVLTSVGCLLQPPEWGCYPDVDQLPPLSSLLTRPTCGGTCHHVVRRCDGTYRNTRRHHYSHTL